MSRKYIIAMDVHCQETEVVVMTGSGKVVRRDRCATTIPKLLEIIESVPRPRDLVIEEGPLAGWLYRNLSGHVNTMVSCDARRNHLIAKDSDKDDSIDAEKLGHLYRGGFTKAVHQSETLDRSAFKQHVGLYQDRVRNRVRQANRVIAQLRRHGLIIRERSFADAKLRPALLKKLPDHAVVRAGIRCLWEGYDVAAKQVREMRALLVKQARREPQIRRFTELPGVQWIRASIFFAYLDTPWRFADKSALWRYLGIGLKRQHSGSGPVLLRLPWPVNGALKSMILGAAKSAIRAGGNPFAEQYERWLYDGLTPHMACRNVARSQAAVMWGMWKSGDDYRPEWVGIPAKEMPSVTAG